MTIYIPKLTGDIKNSSSNRNRTIGLFLSGNEVGNPIVLPKHSTNNFKII